MPFPRIAVFVPDLSDRPGRAAAVALANRLAREGCAVDVVAPMGGGPLRARLDPAIGQIDLAKRSAPASPLALARVLSERRPALLAVPDEVAWVGRLALWLARGGAALHPLTGDAETDTAAILRAIRGAAPRSG